MTTPQDWKPEELEPVENAVFRALEDERDDEGIAREVLTAAIESGLVVRVEDHEVVKQAAAESVINANNLLAEREHMAKKLAETRQQFAGWRKDAKKLLTQAQGELAEARARVQELTAGYDVQRDQRRKAETELAEARAEVEAMRTAITEQLGPICGAHFEDGHWAWVSGHGEGAEFEEAQSVGHLIAIAVQRSRDNGWFACADEKNQRLVDISTERDSLAARLEAAIKPGDQMQSALSRLAEYVKALDDPDDGGESREVDVPYKVTMAALEGQRAVEWWTQIRAKYPRKDGHAT